MFVHVRIGWDGIHIEVNAILCCMVAIVYVYYRFCMAIASGFPDFSYHPRTDWRGMPRRDPPNEQIGDGGNDSHYW